jgi:hypothetical protein
MNCSIDIDRTAAVALQNSRWCSAQRYLRA